MRAHPSWRLPERLLPAVVAVLLLFAWVGHGTAEAADPRLQEATGRRQERQARLDELYQQLAALEADAERLTAELADLQVQEDSRRAEAEVETEALGLRVRESYIHGSTDSTLALLTSESPEVAADRVRMLGVLAVRSQGDVEGASAAVARTEAAAERVRATEYALQTRRQELQTASAEAQALVAEAEVEERAVVDVIAVEEAERLAREGRTGSYRGPGGPAAPVNGDVACPVGGNPEYSNSWGAPRSGGRSHQGTDILEARGVPVYAIENGVMTRTGTNGLGGTILYLRGDSGNVYYYAHLAGYVSGVAAGTPVAAGQHIAFNGDTGNARGITHVHFEVEPGGAGNVNPYPLVLQACG